MTHVVIIGAGIGGIPAVFSMKESLGDKVDITVISETDKFSFTPSNPAIAVGWRKVEEVQENLAEIFKNIGVRFIHDRVYEVIPKRNRVLCAGGTEVEYDYLVLSTGVRVDYDAIKGAAQEQNNNDLCSADSAERTYINWREFIKNPSDMVVGVAQGASCVMPAYEYAMMVDTELRRMKIRDRVNISFVTPEPYLGHFGIGAIGDSRKILEKNFDESEINWIANAKIEKVTKNAVYVSECDEKGVEIKQHIIDSTFNVIMPPFLGSEATFRIDGLVNSKGFVLVDEYQRNPKYRNIFAIGNCVHIDQLVESPVEVGTAKNSYMAESMVTAAVGNITQMIEGKEATNKANLGMICMTDFGDEGIAFVATPRQPPRSISWTSKGVWVHLAKVAFEKYFMHNLRKGVREQIFEKYILRMIGQERSDDRNE